MEYVDVLSEVRNAQRFAPSARQVIGKLPAAPFTEILLTALLKKDKPRIAHRWDGEHGGWFNAKVKSLVTTGENEGKWMVRYHAAQGHAAYDEYHTLNLKTTGSTSCG